MQTKCATFSLETEELAEIRWIWEIGRQFSKRDSNRAERGKMFRVGKMMLMETNFHETCFLADDCE